MIRQQEYIKPSIRKEFEFFAVNKINLTNGEVDLSQPTESFPIPQDFNIESAWELANLTRVAYKDYELFNDFIKKKNNSIFENCIKDKSTIYVPQNISSEIITYYIVNKYETIGAENQSTYEIELDYIKSIHNEYYIENTYNYLGYWNLLPDVDRFGFIATRHTKSDHLESNNKDLLIIFRGTRENTEWFNNFQFKQINFLSRNRDNIVKKNASKDPKISLGFNKVYTDFRPGLFIRFALLNSISTSFNNLFINLNRRIFKEIHKQHNKSICTTIEECLENNLKMINKIYLSGHSLGAALACVSSLHVSKVIQSKKSDKYSDIPILSYLYATPRVGDSSFSKACTESNMTTYRITNSEDLINIAPLAVWRVVGVEINLPVVGKFVRKLFSFLGLENETFQHCGQAVTFTHQAGAISSNHNMTVTYCGALKVLSGTQNL